MKKIILFCIFDLLLLAVGYWLSFYLPAETKDGLTTVLSVSSWKYFSIGFFAVMINGMVGMAYGIITITLLLSIGFSPVTSSFIVHVSEIFNTGALGLIHFKNGNVNKKLFKRLCIPGIGGAVTGAFLLYYFKEYGHLVKYLVSSYTLLMGGFVLLNVFRKPVKMLKPAKRTKFISPLGFIGGFCDAFGGGGWGTIVTSTLLASGRNVLYTIGSVSLSRFFIALAGSVTFLIFIGSIQWSVIIWLVIGGLIAAPIAPYLATRIPAKITTIFVAVLVIIMSLKQLVL